MGWAEISRVANFGPAFLFELQGDEEDTGVDQDVVETFEEGLGDGGLGRNDTSQ